MKHTLLPILLGTLILIADQYSKTAIIGYLLEQQRYIEVTSFFNLVVVYNTGVSFGLFSGLEAGKWILTLLALMIVVVLVIWFVRNKTPWVAYALCLIISGAIGNIIDRIYFGYVRDFLDFHLYGYHWPAFNIADSAVVIGVIMLLLENIVAKEKQ